MDILQRLQPLDILFAILWAAIVGWGLQAGLIRQLGMLVGVFGAFLAAGSLYRRFGQAVALAFGADSEPVFEFIGFVAIFVAVFAVIVFFLLGAYPMSRLKRGFGLDNALGMVVAAIWGVMLLIAMLTVLRFYAVVPWRGQEAPQLSIRGQVIQSQVAPVLEVVTAPLWQVMAPWFPVPVSPHL